MSLDRSCAPRAVRLRAVWNDDGHLTSWEPCVGGVPVIGPALTQEADHRPVTADPHETTDPALSEATLLRGLA